MDVLTQSSELLYGILGAAGAGLILLELWVLRRRRHKAPSQADSAPSLPPASPKVEILSEPLVPLAREPVSAQQLREPSQALVEQPLPSTPPAAPPLAPPHKESEEPLASLEQALAKTRSGFFSRLAGLFSGGPNRGEIWEQLEEALYLSDMGPKTVQRLLKATQDHFSMLNPPSDEAQVRGVLRDEIQRIFAETPAAQTGTEVGVRASLPEVWLIVGVNGVGKTTTIGKLAAQWAARGEKVLVAAGDTFRAAAQSQLQVWTDRAQVEIFVATQTKDPAAVAYSALDHAIQKGYNRVIVDTAGRLHTAVNLMDELKKVKRVLGNKQEGAPQQTVLVVDASQGQNALVQARQFHSAVGLTAAILTKMDGTAKGGVAVGIAEELKLPITYIGVGEKVGDLRPFESRAFIDAIL